MCSLRSLPLNYRKIFRTTLISLWFVVVVVVVVVVAAVVVVVICGYSHNNQS